MLEIGTKIREARIKKALSQEDLAELSKLNLRTIQRIENNESIPRGKTLKLVFDALDIVVIENNSRGKVEVYLIWSSSLTLIMMIGTLLGWLKFFRMYVNDEAMYRVTNGWNGTTNFNGYPLENWFLSITTLSVGLIVVGHSLNLLKYQFKYVVVQMLVLFLYLIAIINHIGVVPFGFEPGLFIVAITTILLIITYYRQGRINKTIKTKQ